MTALDLLDARRLDDVVELCRRCLPEPPSRDELSASLYSPEQRVTVRGAPGVGIVATVGEGRPGLHPPPRGRPRRAGPGPRDRPAAGGRGGPVGTRDDKRASGSGPAVLPLSRGRDDTHGHAVSLGTPRVRTRRVHLQHGCGSRRPSSRSRGPRTGRARPSAPRWRRGCGAHWPHWEAEALRALERSTLVMSRDGDGMAGFCAYDVNRAGLLGPTAVRGDLWGHGMGRPLIVGALHHMRARDTAARRGGLGGTDPPLCTGGGPGEPGVLRLPTGTRARLTASLTICRSGRVPPTVTTANTRGAGTDTGTERTRGSSWHRPCPRRRWTIRWRP